MGRIGESVNTKDVYLIKPKLEDKNALEEFKKEFLLNNEKAIPGSSDILEFSKYEDWLKHIKAYENAKTVPVKGHVPATIYLLKSKCDKRVLGILQIRHILNDFLSNFGGHFGGSIRPSERNKGYSAKMIVLGKSKAKRFGINDVLITCLTTNKSSARSIEKAGGVFEKTVYFKEKEVHINRFWLKTNK